MMMNSLINNENKIEFANEKLQNTNQFVNSMMTAGPFSNTNPYTMTQLDQFPDILQNYSTEQSKMIFDFLIQSNNASLIGKSGALGGYTALHWMCIKNEYDMIEYLIEKFKVDINCKANMGETPLLIAIKNCNYMTIELLIKNGADLTVRDVYNRSIVHWIAYTGKVIIMHYFQKYHSINNLNDVDQFLQNPLHIACASGFQEMINYLLESGQIDLMAQDANGNTCLHMAVKYGLPRICWKIVQQNRGECARMIGTLNKQNQRPIDLIKNEKAPHFRKIRDWLKLEANTNIWLANDINSKKDDEFYKSKSRSPFQLENLFQLNSNHKMKIEWYFRFFSFPLVLGFPILLHYYLFSPDTLTLWRGLINYGGLINVIFMLARQPHRINHISGLENPFHLGFFAILYFHNYGTFYFNLLESFNIFRPYDMFSFIFMLYHTYAYYRIITANPGLTREDAKKPDGTPYTLHDLMKFNTRADAKQAKDSFNWLIQPSLVNAYVAKPNPHPQLYFCESCQIIQAVPSKHCKLCEGCCTKFDHHCVFINKCVGLKNHRTFILFLITTILCEFAFFHAIIVYMINQNEEIRLYNLNKDVENQISLIYLCFASRFHVRLIAVSFINVFTTFMVITLLSYQLKYIALGYTTQFGPPSFLFKSIKELKTSSGAILFRLKNLFIFFFESDEENSKLYFKYQKECWAHAPAGSIYDGLYPKDSFPIGFNYPNTNSLNGNGNKSSMKDGHVEIDLK